MHCGNVASETEESAKAENILAHAKSNNTSTTQKIT